MNAVVEIYRRLESDLKLAKTSQTLEDQAEIKRLRETIREANLKLSSTKHQYAWLHGGKSKDMEQSGMDGRQWQKVRKQ
ncbi:hypothetical protein J1N35_014968 [Gossypium stocksii]|uniref:Uncharacterized protein n=1 Tax=Gossypium stocksii TaxID=47602 RepID=A0A9D4AAE5_9ROSI|nr:hypothetical protein J1N35_014968 [Gossypium stocksii]